MGKIIKPPPGDGPSGESLLADLVSEKGSSKLRSFHSIKIDGQEIDAVIVNRGSGRIYVVEVKDWKSHWHPVDDEKWVSDKEKVGATDPYQQAWKAHIRVRNRLEQSPLLLETGGDKKGKLRFPVHPGPMFTNLSRESLAEFENHSFFPRSLFSEDCDPERVENGAFDEVLEKIEDPRLHRWKKAQLTDQELDEIAALLTNRVKGQRRPDEPQIEAFEHPFVDRYVSILGHAGTGKSLVLLARARKILTTKPDWRVLLLTRNILMKHLLAFEWGEAEWSGPTPEFRDFNSWAWDLGFRGDPYSETAARFIEAQGKADYQAILVDEGQDFDEAMLRGIHAHLNRSRAANSFTICRDPWQDIYHADVGRNLPNILGHSVSETIELNRKYRCIVDIAQFARTFILMARDGLPEDHSRIQSLYEAGFSASFPARVAENLGKTWRFLNTDIKKLGKALKKLEPVTVVTTADPLQAVQDSVSAIWDVQERARIKGEGALNRIAAVYTDKGCLGNGKSAADLLDESLETAGIRRYLIATKGQTERPHVEPHDAEAIKRILADTEPHVVVTNVWQLKGLEADAAVLVGADSTNLVDGSGANSIVYVGLTRGRVLLHVVLSEELQNSSERARTLQRAFGVYHKKGKQ